MRLHGASWVALCCLVAAAYLFSGCSAAQFTARRALRTSSNENGQLMADFTAAAAAGDMELTLQLQNQLLKHSEEAYKSSNRRKLLQIDCRRAASDLLPCATFSCVTASASALRRGATGNITCVTPPPPSPSPVDVTDFIYFLPYDYDVLWDTDADNVLAGGSTTSDTRLVNQFQSADGNVGFQSNLQSTDNRRIIPNPNLGIRADDSSRIDFYNTKFAVGTDAQKPLTFTDTTNGGATAGGTFGAYWPGVTATPRTYDNGGTEDNVALTIGNLNAMKGYHKG